MPAILWAIMIFFASSIPSKYLTSQSLLAFDKLIHFTLFFIFGILIFRALQPVDDTNPKIIARIFLSISIVIFYGIMDEFHQEYVPGRTIDLYDAIADTAGGIAAGFFIYLKYKKSIKK